VTQAIELHEAPSGGPGEIADERAAASRGDGRVVRVERHAERLDAFGVEDDDVPAREPRGESRPSCGIHGDDDTGAARPGGGESARGECYNPRVRPAAIVVGAVLWLQACASVVNPMPFQPFPDLPTPAEWTPYSDDWAIIRSPKVTAARLIYFTMGSLETTLADGRRLLARAGWSEKQSERFVNAENFPGVWAEFGKGDDLCRLTIIEGKGATHVEYTVARINPAT
jgi:hypothetical protein